MLASVKKLIYAYNCGRKSAKYGNHSFQQDNRKAYFMYHGNCICEVDKATNKAIYSYCGWSGSSSTTRSINSYKDYFGEGETTN